MYPGMNGDIVWKPSLTPANLEDFGIYVNMVSLQHDRNYGGDWTEIHRADRLRRMQHMRFEIHSRPPWVTTAWSTFW